MLDRLGAALGLAVQPSLHGAVQLVAPAVAGLPLVAGTFGRAFLHLIPNIAMTDDAGDRDAALELRLQGDAVLLHQPGDQLRRACQLGRGWLLHFGRLRFAVQIGAHEAADQTDRHRVVIGLAAHLVRANVIGLAVINRAVWRDDVVIGDARPLLFEDFVAILTHAVDVVVGDVLHRVGEGRVGVMHRNQADRAGARDVGRQRGVRFQLADHIDHHWLRHTGGPCA